MDTARDRRSGVGLALYLTAAVLLLIFSILSGFSIGLFIMPIPLVMFFAVAAWSRPWIVAGLVAGVAAGSLGYLLTAPLVRFERTSVWIGDAEPAAGLSGCSRALLPSVPVDECDDAQAQAVAIAAASALGIGLGAGVAVRAGVRPRRRPSA